MLPKKHRTTFYLFQSNRDIPKFFNFTHTSYALKNNGGELSRFVIITPKKLDKRSVYRHRTKRIISEVIEKNLNNLKKSTDVLIKAKIIIKKEEKKKVQEDILECFKKAGIII